MQNDRLRDFLKFFRFHLAWFILSAGFFAVILISGVFLSTKYVVDTATEQISIDTPSATPEELQLAVPETPESPVAPSPVATILPVATPSAVPTLKPILPTPEPVVPDQSVTESPSLTAKADYYTVKKGDTLWQIAQTQLGDGLLFTRISQDNNIKNPSLIFEGQKLHLTSSTQQGKITDSAWSEDKTTYKNYSVVQGDSLWKIAERELGDPYRWVELYQINRAVIGDNPDLIYPRTVIRIPQDHQPLSVNPHSFNWTSSLLQ